MGRGLQHADAQDLSQQVLMAVASAIGKWEKRDESTRFRHWLSRGNEERDPQRLDSAAQGSGGRWFFDRRIAA